MRKLSTTAVGILLRHQSRLPPACCPLPPEVGGARAEVHGPPLFLNMEVFLKEFQVLPSDVAQECANASFDGRVGLWYYS